MSEVLSTDPATAQAPPSPKPSVEVFAVYGVEPEIQAYAMAKYSRSSLSMKESLKEITLQKAEKFLNTFYFQYGHRSIADLAHIAFAVERLSLLAAIVLVDETRWDGQERSTRYQNFLESGFYVPDFAGDSVSKDLYDRTIESLMAAYKRVSLSVLDLLRKRGYRFITLEDALSDSAYSLPDTFVGEEGSGWIEHWAITQGKIPQGEPAMPQWVIDKTKDLHLSTGQVNAQ